LKEQEKINRIFRSPGDSLRRTANKIQGFRVGFGCTNGLTSILASSGAAFDDGEEPDLARLEDIRWALQCFDIEMPNLQCVAKDFRTTGARILYVRGSGQIFFLRLAQTAAAGSLCGIKRMETATKPPPTSLDWVQVATAAVYGTNAFRTLLSAPFDRIRILLQLQVR
jgi:hypothetical protein